MVEGPPPPLEQVVDLGVLVVDEVELARTGLARMPDVVLVRNNFV